MLGAIRASCHLGDVQLLGRMKGDVSREFEGLNGYKLARKGQEGLRARRHVQRYEGWSREDRTETRGVLGVLRILQIRAAQKAQLPRHYRVGNGHVSAGPYATNEGREFTSPPIS